MCGSVAVVPALIGCNQEPASSASPQSAAQAEQQRTGDVREVSCADHFVVETPVGVVTNNVWNKQAAEGAYKQCILARGSSGQEQYGWRWRWPAHSTVVLAYPETVVGWKPWVGGDSTTPELPIRIDAIDTLRWSYAVETTATGDHNLATSLWLTRTGKTQAAPNPDDLSTELMIWTHTGGFPPAGSRQALITIDGREFEVWYSANWGDMSGQSSNRWNYLAYRATRDTLSASLDLKKFLENAAQRGLVARDHYVSNVELGNEVMSGSGTTWIENATLEVKRAAAAGE